MEDILRTIDRALERLGLTDRAASLKATGRTYTLREMRRGSMPRLDTLRALCETLELEFYIGPPRDAGRACQASALGCIFWYAQSFKGSSPSLVASLEDTARLLTHFAESAKEQQRASSTGSRRFPSKS